MKFEQFKQPGFGLVVKMMARSRQLLLLLAALFPLLLLPLACSKAEEYILRQKVEILRYAATAKRCLVEDMLDSVALLLTESASNVRYIDVGRTSQPDTDLEAALACQELSHGDFMHDSIASAYLVCNLNHTVYNSVDSQGYAMEEFYDLSWQQQYFSSKGGLQLLDTPRTIYTPAWQDEEYISMISRVPYLSTLQNKYLIFNISLESLAEKLALQDGGAAPGETGMALWLYNKNGRLLWDQSGGNAPDSSDELPLAEEPASGWHRLTVNGTDYIMVTAASTAYDWTFAECIPYSYIAAECQGQNTLIISLACGSSIVMLLAMFFFLYDRQLQILRAGQNIYLQTRQEIEEGENCLDYLQRICAEKNTAWADGKMILDTFGGIMEQNIVLSLVQGEEVRKADQNAYEKVMGSMNLLGDTKQHYTVFLARIEAITALKMNLHQNVYSRFRRILQYSCNEQLPEDFEANYAWEDYSIMVGILHFPQQMNAKHRKDMLDHLGLTLQKQLTLLSEQPVLVAFGDVMEDPWHLVESYGHAKQLLQHKVYHHKERPFTYQDMVEGDMQLSYDRQKQLVDQIKLGQVEQTREQLERYFSILHSNPDVGLEQVQQICTSLATVVHHAIGEKEKELEERFANVDRVHQAMMEMTTVHDVADYLVEYAQAAAQAMLEQMQRKKDIRVQDILEWIENNYNTDISLDDIAAQMNLSPTYASKQIKMYTGQSVVNYINQVRIEHAKELLAHTRMSSNEIGARVGFRYSQSFIRAFRKSAGMTPGNYRSLHQKEPEEKLQAGIKEQE